MNEELKHCPFCAQEPMDVPLESMFHTFRIICPHCETVGPELMTLTDAIEAWNRRPAPQARMRLAQQPQETLRR
jgi:Lar family restriction alleviation protein